MTFDEVINDIEKMVGLELESIKPGANIILTGVDWKAQRIELITSAGKEKTRPFSELKKIWDKLCSSPAAHVDSVLGGSGSSRNQPETLMANLPYIEWFFIDGKKHLALTKEHTHDYGTLYKMDEVKAIEIKDKLLVADKTKCEVVVVTDNIRATAETFESITGLPLNPESPGIYEQYIESVRYLIVLRNSLKVKFSVGTYVVVSGKNFQEGGYTVSINEREYTLLTDNGLNILVKN